MSGITVNQILDFIANKDTLVSELLKISAKTAVEIEQRLAGSLIDGAEKAIETEVDAQQDVRFGFTGETTPTTPTKR